MGLIQCPVCNPCPRNTPILLQAFFSSRSRLFCFEAVVEGPLREAAVGCARWFEQRDAFGRASRLCWSNEALFAELLPLATTTQMGPTCLLWRAFIYALMRPAAWRKLRSKPCPPVPVSPSTPGDRAVLCLQGWSQFPAAPFAATPGLQSCASMSTLCCRATDTVQPSWRLCRAPIGPSLQASIACLDVFLRPVCWQASMPPFSNHTSHKVKHHCIQIRSPDVSSEQTALLTTNQMTV
jgi:hypothetical protein